jgi:death-on-curing family protein
MENQSQLIIYQTSDNQTQIEVQFEGENFWLTQEQISLLFERDRTVVGKHLRNIFKSGELDERVVCANFAHTTKHGAIEGKTQEKSIKYYNLDAILSVGYRVNSKRGTQFRQWATQRLKEHLVQGYTINQKRLDQLQKTVELIQKTADNETTLNETKGLLDIITHYTQSFSLLNQYDSNTIVSTNINENITYEIKYEEAKTAINELKKQLIARKEASSLFGNEKDNSFSGILQSVIQTFDGKYLYPSIEEQAAHLLYFIIKGHPFSDGNKRIGAFLFVWFLEKNRHRFKRNGELKINDNTLVALALLVAQSNPNEKELMVNLVVNLINLKA